ncbi:MAG: translation initiation factor IF-2, partial [Bacteroidaceae bacterium]|nr:translation initiation factor IF-2 [Bacteroidaceae bacterium]
MKIRLNKVQKELNLGISTIVDFLQKKGFEIKEDPNAVVPEAGYEMLIQEFSADKKARIQSDNFLKERQNKEKPKAAPVVEEKPAEKKPAAEPAPKAVEVPKPAPAPEPKEEPKKEEPLIKVTRRIDLDALNKKSQPKKEEPKPAPAPVQKPEPVAKAEETAPVVEEPVKSEHVSEEPQAQLTQIDEVVAPKFNIVGQIDLSAINQSTRPKKKSKEEKKKEREEKDKQREEQRKQQREAQRQQNGGEGDKKKKRQRINSQRVDINDVK